jgi:segregation and condensation protein A
MAEGDHISISENGEGRDPFAAPARQRAQEGADMDALIINLDGYEGPLDVLLDLARRQKVDIRKISMAALVDQYLAFIHAVRQRDLELAADYLVMAAWLAYLKTRLLLPADQNEDGELSGDEMAARLAFQLQRLEAMRKAVDALQARPKFGVDFFPRGTPEGVRVTRRPDWQDDLYDLLRAYAVQRIAAVDRNYHYAPPPVYSIEMARLRLERLLGSIPDWTMLSSLTRVADVDAPAASVTASAFIAALEFAKDGRIDIRQLGAFEPIYIKALREEDEKDRQ